MKKELNQRIKKAKHAKRYEWMHIVIVTLSWILIILFKGDYTPVVTMEYIAFIIFLGIATYVYVYWRHV